MGKIEISPRHSDIKTLSMDILKRSGISVKFKFKLWILKPTIILLISVIITYFIKINATALFPLLVNILIYSLAYFLLSFGFKIISKAELKSFL